MAIIRLDCNLNGGDSVTPNNELFYRIYGDIDSYTAPIWTTGTALSDANVTVNNDIVIITGVDGATNTSFKIAAVDGAGNEGELSDSNSSNVGLYFNGTTVGQFGKGALTNPPNTGDATIECRWKQSAGNTALKVFFGIGVIGGIGNSKGGISILMNSADTAIRFAIGDGTSAQSEQMAMPNDGEYHLYKIVATSNGAYECFIDDVSVATGVTTLGILANSDYVYLGGSGAVVESVKGTLDWGIVNNETFELNEGSGTTTTGSEGTVATLNGDPQWVYI